MKHSTLPSQFKALLIAVVSNGLISDLVIWKRLAWLSGSSLLNPVAQEPVYRAYQRLGP